MKTIAGFLALLLISSSTFASEKFLYPVGGRLEGVGGFGGALLGLKSLRSERGAVVGGALFGVTAQGLAAIDLPITSCLSISAGYLNLDRVRLATNYARGLNSGREFEQAMSGTVIGTVLHCNLAENRWRVSVGYLQSRLNLDDFYVDGRSIQRPSVAGYHAVTTQSKTLQILYKKDEFLTAKAEVTTAEGRFGQSDHLISNYSLTTRWPAWSRVTLINEMIWSDAYLLTHKPQFEDETSVRQALNTNCNSLSNPQQAQDCHDLENALASYIAANNARGTAAPAGGHQGVRAYHELSLRSRHTRVAKAEARVRVLPRLSVAPTFDLGWSSDHEENLYKRATTAYGAAIRYEISASAARLGYAQNDQESAWYLAIDSAF